jgi:hypothetical protein
MFDIVLYNNCVDRRTLWVAQLEERQTVMVECHLNVTGSIPVPEMQMFFFFLNCVAIVFSHL